VIVPTFNRPKYLSKALAGVLQQSYRNLQVIKIRILIRQLNYSKQQNKYFKICPALYQTVACFRRRRSQSTKKYGMGILEGKELLWI